MARLALVVDASVGVKWFSDRGESGLAAALAIRDDHMAGEHRILVPDLFFYEVANALAHKPYMPTEVVQRAAQTLFAFGLETIPMSGPLMNVSIGLARDLGITVYDACYAALARERGCPLVTANPRHQGRDLGCQIISIEKWLPGERQGPLR